MFSLRRSERSPIAVYVHASHLAAVQLVRTRGQWTPALTVNIRRKPAPASPTPIQTPAQAAATPPAEQGSQPQPAFSEAELAALGDALARQGAVGRDIVLIAPPAATCTQLLELPPRSAGTPMDALARAEIARLSRWGDAERFQLLTWDVPPPPSRAGAGSGDAAVALTTMAAAAAPESALEPIIDALAAAHWRTVGVVPASQAAAVVAAEATLDRDATGSVVIDLAWDRASLTVSRNGVALYHRDLPDNGLSLLARGLTAELHLSAADAESAIEMGTVGFDGSSPRAQGLVESFADSLAAEIDATLAFAARRYGDLSPRHLHVLGDGTRVRGLGAALRARLDLPADQAGTSPPADALAGAAAQLIADPKYGPGLLPTGQRLGLHRDRLAHRWVAAAACVAGAAVAGLAFLYGSTVRPTAPLESRIDASTREQARLNADLASLDRLMSAARARASFRDRLANQPDYSALLRIVGSSVGPSTVLSELAILDPVAPVSGSGATRSPAVRRLRLAGATADASALNEQVDALRQLDIFDRVELARTSRGADGHGVRFELTLNLVTPPTPPTLPTGAQR